MPSADRGAKHTTRVPNTVPFWTHQLVEVLLAVLLLVEGARTGQHVVPVVAMGAVVLLASMLTDGPLGAWPIIPRRVHRWLDVALATLLAASPFLFGIRQPLGFAILVGAAAAVAWLAWRTNWSSPRSRARAPRSPVPRPPPIDAAAAPPGDMPGAAPPRVPAARHLGAAVRRARRDGPRQLGRAVGRARRRRPPPG